jgi:predicted transposase YbfD/YdcC
LLSALLHREGIVLAQHRVADKTNEITGVEPLLKNLTMQGAVVTGDAMHVQKATATFLVEEKKADYVFTVKENQPTLRKHIEDLGLSSFSPSRRNGR